MDNAMYCRSFTESWLSNIIFWYVCISATSHTTLHTKHFHTRSLVNKQLVYNNYFLYIPDFYGRGHSASPSALYSDALFVNQVCRELTYYRIVMKFNY